MPFIDQLTMNLVCHNEHPVMQADVTDAPQFLRRPDPSDRIVRIAQQQDFRLRIGRLCFEVVEVNRVAAVPINEVVGRQFASIIANRRIETVVCRSLDDYLVTRCSQSFDNSGQSWHDTVRIDNPPGIYLPAMPVIEPPDNRVVVGFGDFGIAENTMRYPLLQGFNNSWCCTEIHIRHPHRQYILLFGSIPFVRIRPAPRDDCIEIVFHNLSFYS